MDNLSKIDCKYGDKCYQKNPNHHLKYNHPSKTIEKQLNVAEDASNSNPTPGPSDIKETVLESKETQSEKNSDSSINANEIDITKEYEEVMKNLSEKNYFEILQNRIRYSTRAEYLDLLKSNDFIRHKFLVEMPEDFYTFWEFSLHLAEQNNDMFRKVGLKLVGPFEFLDGKFHKAKIQEPGDYLRHYRFYFDPPEFQTIFVKEKSGIHYGYWRDEPTSKDNLLLARNDVLKNCEFEFVGANCFDVLLYYLNNDLSLTPFNKGNVEALKKSAISFAAEHKVILNNLNVISKERQKHVAAKTFHKAGLVVPYNKKTQVGYRPLIESDATIKKILHQLDATNNDNDPDVVLREVKEKLQPIIVAATIATDECDFGTSLELGLGLFSSGHKELHDVIMKLLVPVYSLLKRPQFIAILKSHLSDRKKGIDVGAFEFQ